jgi:hypothetical protein
MPALMISFIASASSAQTLNDPGCFAGYRQCVLVGEAMQAAGCTEEARVHLGWCAQMSNPSEVFAGLHDAIRANATDAQLDSYLDRMRACAEKHPEAIFDDEESAGGQS